jgi:hypothetical protein
MRIVRSTFSMSPSISAHSAPGSSLMPRAASAPPKVPVSHPPMAAIM